MHRPTPTSRMPRPHLEDHGPQHRCRRLCNQAFFTKVYIEEDDELRVESARPFEMLLDPDVNADALTWAANADKARTPTLDSLGQGSSLVRWVPPTGLEPVTHGLKVHCSTN